MAAEGLGNIDIWGIYMWLGTGELAPAFSCDISVKGVCSYLVVTEQLGVHELGFSAPLE